MKNRYVDDEANFLQGIELSGPRVCYELDGAVELGMKTDALRRARQLLRRCRVTTKAFAAAFDAVMIQANRAKRWRRLIESAYARLSKADQRACRSRMLSFHWANGDYEVAAQFIPRRFNQAADPVDVAIALETLAELGRLSEARRLVPRCAQGVRRSVDAVTKAHLLAAVAVYHTKAGDWEQAIDFWQQSLWEDDSYAENALLGIVEIRLLQALQSARNGLETLEKLKRQHDPKLETTLPGNQRKRWEKLHARLIAHGTILERVLSRSKRLGS